MSFLAPLFLLGALAVALPVLFHLTRRSTNERQIFSTLMFFRPTPPRLTQRNRIEHWLLLLLRCVVIALLALAFARPFFRAPAAMLPQTAPAERWVVLLDTSASMRRQGMWSAATEEYRKIVEELRPDDELAVLTFDRQVRSALTLAQWRGAGLGERRALALAVAEQIEPGWAATRLDLGLIAAAELLEEADALSEERILRRIRIVTDLQSGAQLSGLQGYTWPSGVEIMTHMIRPAVYDNAGVQWLAGGESDSGTNQFEGIRVRITNATDSRQDQFELRWHSAVGGEPMRVQVAPGQSRVFGLANGGAAQAEGAVLSGDPHEFDNRIYTLPPRQSQRRVWFWSADHQDDPRRLGFYLGRAFPDTNRVELVKVTTDAGAAGIVAGEALLVGAGEATHDWAASARDWVEEGGTLLWVLDDTKGAETLRVLLGSGDLRVNEAEVRDYAMLSQVDFRHPVFAPFADPRYSDFTKIHFWRHRQVQFEGVKELQVLARFDGGDPALVETAHGRGRILVLMAGWHPADGQLALSTKFVPLLHALVEYATATDAPRLQIQYYVGDTVPLRSEGAPTLVTMPDGRDVTVAGAEFRETWLPGVYQVKQGTDTWRFAVNLDPAETRTTPMSHDELERLGVPMTGSNGTRTQVESRVLYQREVELEGQQKLWRWLVLGALIFVGLESWLSGRLTRRRGEAGAG